MSATRAERFIAGVVVFGALLVAVGAPVWWGDAPRWKPTGNYWQDVVLPQEARLLLAYSDVVQRHDLVLTVRLFDGNAKEYRDDKYTHELRCGLDDDSSVNDCIAYGVWEISADRRYVTLWVALYEGGDALLVDRETGAEVGLDSPPHAAPDGRHWASVDHDTAYGSGDIDVVATESGAPAVIATEAGVFCSFERWDSDASFLVGCGSEESSARVEYRVTWKQNGTILRVPTGRNAPEAP